MHFDLWLSIRGGVASTPEFGGRQRPLPICEMKATRRGSKARRRSDRRHRDVDGRYGAIREFASRSRLGDYAEHAESVLSLSTK